jgi:hypothetical protein
MERFDFRYLGNSQNVHNVLCLRRRGEKGEDYQRIGGGMIFGKDFVNTAEIKLNGLIVGDQKGSVLRHGHWQDIGPA